MCQVQDKQAQHRSLAMANQELSSSLHSSKGTQASTKSNVRVVVSLSPSRPSLLDDSYYRYSERIAVATRSLAFQLNAQTKWILYLVNTIALWARPDRYEGPMIVFGAIAAIYFTELLKKIINQSRPAGAPFTDPGMPSAHSLTSFFLASAWASILPVHFFLSQESLLLWSTAATVAYLRVVCGYHSWAQIFVGAVLGTVMGGFWMELGQYLYELCPLLFFCGVWILYLGMAALFMVKKMNQWTTHERNL